MPKTENFVRSPLLRRTLATCAAIASCASGACLPAFAEAPRKPPESPRKVVLSPCRVDGVPFAARCGTVQVREDRSGTGGRLLPIHVTVLPSRAAAPRPDPVFYFAAGQSVAASDEAATVAGGLQPLLADRDLVLVDLRGTGKSNPLRCRMGFGPLPYPTAPGAVEACRKALSAQADLAQYTAANAADDLDEVRAALGYATVDLYARAYGTVDAQAFLRRHGDRVRAAVLEGLVPADPLAATLESENAMRALGLLFADCAGEVACAKAFPHPDNDLADALDRLGKPVEVAVRDARGGAATVEMTRELFVATIRARFASAQEIARLPRALHRAAAGDFADMAQTAWSIQQAQPPYEGALLSAACSGSLRGVDAAAVRERATGSFLSPEPQLRRLAACAIWPMAPAETKPATPPTKAPVLVLSGTLDPVTSPYWADRAIRGFGEARQVRVPHGGQLLLDPCVSGLAATFFRSGSLADLDASCAEHSRGVPFLTAP